MSDLPRLPEVKLPGRGAAGRPAPRYMQAATSPVYDGWGAPDVQPLVTTVTEENPRTIISRNSSPDIPFSQSINPYRGCEHGCIYCYARPTHAWLDLSPGLDFESKLFAKANAAVLLRRELAAKAYHCKPIAIGTNTDPYQPLERKRMITRSLLEVLRDTKHPLLLTTKSSMVERDIDILSDMASDGLVHVYISITTLDSQLAASLEPRATAPNRRLRSVAKLVEAGIPTGVLFAPVIPFVNDHEMESVLEQSAAAGADYAGYVMLRLPHEVAQLFEQWLQLHRPDSAKRVLSVVRSLRDGKLNDAHYGSRMRGQGAYADLIQKRFALCRRKYGLAQPRRTLNCSAFKPPVLSSPQLQLL